MIPNTLKRLNRYFALGALLFVGMVLLSVLSGCATLSIAAPLPTYQPTETAVPLTTATAAPVPAFVDLPTVEWSDVSVFKQAMKAGFEGDVDRVAPTANRYLIVAKLSIETDAIIRGAERVRYRNRTRSALNLLVFRLYPNTTTLGGTMNVTRVRIGTEVVQPQYGDFGSLMIIPLKTPLEAGATIELTLDFVTIMSRNLDTSYGRFGYVDNVVSATAWYPTLSVYEPNVGWSTTFPNPQGDPAFTETGLYDVRLTVPAKMNTFMSGKIIDQRPNDDATVTLRGVTGPMRDVAFQSSERYVNSPVSMDGTQINIVHYKDRATATDGTSEVQKYALQSVKAYNKIFGDYPYAELNIVQNPTPTGVEFPGLVQISAKAWVRGNDFLEKVVAHEVGHQWFYGIVGNDQVNHPWIDESLTSYTEFVYWREYYSAAKADEYVNSFQRGYVGYIGRRFEDQPLDLPVNKYSGPAYGAIVYTKGPLFLVELERQIGRATVYRALSVYFRRMKYGVAYTKDIKQAFEDTSGKDLSAVFAKWVSGGAPISMPPDSPVF